VLYKSPSQEVINYIQCTLISIINIRFLISHEKILLIKYNHIAVVSMTANSVVLGKQIYISFKQYK